MSPTTSIPAFPISDVIAVTFLDSDSAGCTTLAASLSFISCFGLRCDCAELITFSTLGSAFDPSRYDTTQDRCMPSKPRFANPTGQPQMFVKPEPRMLPTTRLLTRQANRPSGLESAAVTEGNDFNVGGYLGWLRTVWADFVCSTFAYFSPP